MPPLLKLDPVPGLSGPPPSPLFGRRGNLSRFVKNPIAFLGELHGRYGRVAAINRNDPFMISALGPEYNQLILSDPKRFGPPEDAGLGEERPPEDNALVRLTKDPTPARRNQQRRMILPSLHPNALSGYVGKMVETADRVLDSWKPGQSIDALVEMRRTTLWSGLAVFVGMAPEEYADDALGERYYDWIRLVYLSSLSFFPNRLPGSRFWRLIQISERLEKVAREVIANKRNNLGEDLLSVLLKAEDAEGEPLTDDELVSITHGLLVLSHQQMSYVLSWSLFCLSQHPAMLARAQEEVDGVLQGAPPTYEKLSALKTVHWVLDEAMRLFAPMVYQQRFAKDRFALGSLELPKHSRVIFNTFYTHRMPSIYPNPNRFDPLRWETTRPSPFEFLPFGYGANACVGRDFAYVGMKVILSMLLQRFQPSLAPNAIVDYVIDPALRPRELPMKMLDRQTKFERNPPLGRIHELIELA